MRALPLLLAATIIAGGCNRHEPPATPEGEATTAAAATATQTTAPDDYVPSEPVRTQAAVVTMRYACDEGNTVEVLDTDSARVTLADGRVVEVPLVAGSSPPAYVGEAVAFAVGSSGAKLTQEEGGVWNCKPS